jgi:hypothetical protein
VIAVNVLWGSRKLLEWWMVVVAFCDAVTYTSDTQRDQRHDAIGNIGELEPEHRRRPRATDPTGLSVAMNIEGILM